MAQLPWWSNYSQYIHWIHSKLVKHLKGRMHAAPHLWIICTIKRTLFSLQVVKGDYNIIVAFREDFSFRLIKEIKGVADVSCCQHLGIESLTIVVFSMKQPFFLRIRVWAKLATGLPSLGLSILSEILMIIISLTLEDVEYVIYTRITVISITTN